MELIEYKEMREAIQRVREIHKEFRCKCVYCKDAQIEVVCHECHDDYPCMTLMALDGE